MRVPRRLARVGAAADLPDAAAFDAYVGPSGEVTVDHVRGIIALHDGATAGGIQFAAGGGGGAGDMLAATYDPTNKQADAFDRANHRGPLYPCGRLTLASGSPVATADVAGATTIYYTPSAGNLLTLYDGTAWNGYAISELSLPLNANAAHTGYHAANANFDVFAFLDGATLRLGTGPSWAAGAVAGSATARGTGAGSTELESFGGLLVNKNDITLRFGVASGDTAAVPARRALYLGSFRPVVAGQASDTKGRRLLFNAYNQALRNIYVTDPTPNYTYTSSAYRIYGGLATNRVQVICGLSGVIADVTSMVTYTTSAATYRNAFAGIGLDSETSAAADMLSVANAAISGAAASAMAFWKGSPGLGFHEINWLHKGSGSDVQTWLGTPASFPVGLSGTVMM